ncbi:MAG TPA: FAD-dependent oxidoreductase [Acidimicrobiales bacterium]|nr:FAD-dependent oxidoreductase [Acidimicrobiales bacterium]
MATSPTFVIVGASLAGAKAAETLRAEGFDGRVVLVGEEPARPYERPPLSKAYLRGEADFDVAAVHEGDYYAANDIELRTSTTVTALDTQASKVTLASGETIVYDRLLLATGAVPRRITVPGADLGGVRYLRTVADADQLRQDLAAGSQVVVIGAGWIGAEVAASARQLGASVSVVERGAVPLERVLGPEVGNLYRDLHAEHGVDLHFGTGVRSLVGNGAVAEVRLTDGTVLPADLVVVGVGVTPRTELAETAGLVVDNGIVVDQYLATSAPGVYAAGDVANSFHPLYGQRVRLEHWSAALNQGPVAAKNMLGKTTVYDKVPYFFSDQYDFGMEYTGYAPKWDELVFRGSLSAREFIAFWLYEGRVVAGMNANIWDVASTIEGLVRGGQVVDRAMLVDTEVDLASLVAPPHG